MNPKCLMCKKDVKEGVKANAEYWRMEGVICIECFESLSNMTENDISGMRDMLDHR